MAFHADTVNKILDYIGGVIGNIVDKVASAIQFLVGPVADQLRAFVVSVANSIGGVIDQLSNIIAAITENIVGFLSDLIDQITVFAQGLFNQFIEQVRAVFNEVVESITNIVNAVIENITDLLAAVRDWLQEALDAVFMAIGNAIDTVVEFINNAYDFVAEKLASLFNAAADLLDAIAVTVAGKIADLIDDGALVAKQIGDVAVLFATDVVDVIGASVNDLIKTVADLPDKIVELSDALIQSAKDNIGKPLAELGTVVIAALAEALGDISKQEQAKAQAFINAVNNLNIPSGGGGDGLPLTLEQTLPDQPFLRLVVTTIASLIMAIQVPVMLAQIGAQQVLYGHSLQNPWQRLSLPQLTAAAQRDVIGTDKLSLDAGQLGYRPEDIDIALELNRVLPDVGFVLTWMLREFVTPGEARNTLIHAGYSPDNADNLIKSAFFIPPVQDLITMAVREAFSPGIAEAFGQFQDFPEQFAKFAAQQGVSHEWATRYWAAHWGLPSPQMGFEMLHRRIIDTPTLELLLRALDVMPFWRDKIIQLSFAPYTRVDIRRMHSVGVLTDAEVMSAHLDLGYNQDKASKLTEFVLRLNTKDDDDSPAKAKTLQQAQVLQFFRDGTINEETAVKLLQDLGYTADLATILVSQAHLQDLSEERKQAIDSIIEQAKAGLLSFTQARDALGKLGAEQGESDKALAKILRATKTATRLPSRSELDKFLSLGLISGEDYVGTLELLGYSNKWAQLFLIVNAGKQNAKIG